MNSFCHALSVVACLSSASVAHTADDRAAINIVAKENQIDFTSGKELIASYHYGPKIAKPYLWPVRGPEGRILTRGWPMEKPAPGGSFDHVHQKSVWFCHGDVIPEGLEIKQKVKGVQGIDFWAEGKGRGQIVCTHVGDAVITKDHGRVETQNEWRTADGSKVLDERRIIHFHDFGDVRLFVFDIDLTASVMPITFGDTKEGSFGIRINDAIREQTHTGKIENANGNVGEKSCWGQLSAWCDYSGALDGKVVGLAVLDDPANPYRACWHARGYGLMAANPFGRNAAGFPAMKGKSDLVELAKGEQLKLRYGVLIHSGDSREGKVAEYFERFVKLRQ